MSEWNDLAKTALSEPDKPIATSATNITKFGAPAAALVAATVTLVLGNEWDLDPSRSEVVIAAATIAAAVLLGVYYAFASDVRTRGAVTISRFETLGELAVEEMRQDAKHAEAAAALKESNAARDAALAAVTEAETDLKAAEAARDQSVADLASQRTGFVADLKNLLEEHIAARLEDLEEKLKRPTPPAERHE